MLKSQKILKIGWDLPLAICLIFYLQMLNIVVRGGEGRDVREGVTADRGVGALTLSNALNMPWST